MLFDAQSNDKRVSFPQFRFRSFVRATISSQAEFEGALVTWLLSRQNANGNRNGLRHCHSAIVQKLVAPLLHNSWTTVLFDCIIPVGGPCNVHITRVCTLLISIDCQRASGRPRFRTFLTCINTCAVFTRVAHRYLRYSLQTRVHE